MDTVDASSPEDPDVAVTPVPFPKLPAARPGSVEGGLGWKGTVFSGSVFEASTIRLPPGVRVVVPENAIVTSGAKPGTAELYVEKSLGFRGHPPAGMPAAGVRQNMGIATKEEGTTLVLATFGEWSSKEGGASVDLVVRVPDGIEVARRAGLSGGGSEAAAWPPDAPAAKTDAGRIGYWYAPTNPRPGWAAVAMKPDDRRVARAFPRTE